MTFAPRTWVVGEVVDAATMNLEIRDQFNSMFDTWTTYSPTWSAVTTPPSIGNGSLTGRYIKIGRTVIVSVKLTFGGTTSAGSGAYTFTVPFASANSVVEYMGAARLTGASAWHGLTILNANASVFSPVFPGNASTTTSVTMDHDTPKTLLSGDILRMQLTYQSAI